jgi:hypothetical protein
LFCNQAIEKYLSWWKVQEQIQAVVATQSAPVAALTRKHEIFQFGLHEWLELVVKLVMDEVGRLSKIGYGHPTWLGDTDPAQWARLNVQKFVSEFLNQEVSTKALVTAFQEGTSLLRSKDDPPSNARPAVEMWFGMASEGPRYSSWPSSTKPWRAPVWCAECFTEPWWIRLGRPSHLSVDQTKSVVRSAQSKFAGRLEYVLRDAEDLQRVECASLTSTHTDSSLRDPERSILNHNPAVKEIARSPSHAPNFRSPLKNAVWESFMAKPQATAKDRLAWLQHNYPKVIPAGWDDTLAGKYFPKVHKGM